MTVLKRKYLLQYIIPFIVGAVFIVFGVEYYFSTEKAKIKNSKDEELELIASLKIKQLSDWYADELTDAATIVKDKYFSKLFKFWIDNPTAEQTAELADLLEQLVMEHGYKSVLIVSNDFSQKIESNIEFSHLSEFTLSTAKEVKRTGRTLSSDIFICQEDNQIFIDFITPLLIDSDIKGIAIFRHDPESFLFPIITNWPVPNKTAETLIFRKEGENALFLNNVRHKANSALRLAQPLSKEDTPLAMAVKGKRGIVDGVDYRGNKVHAYIDSVPSTPWFIVSKVDMAELFDNFFFNSASTFFISGVGIVLLLLLLYIFYTQQQKNLFKKLYSTQQEYKTILYSIGDAVITTDKNGLVITLNPIAEILTGWTEQEAMDKPIEDVFRIIHEENRMMVENPVKKVLKEGIIIGLSNHTLLITKQGDEIPIADSGAPIFDKNGAVSGVVLVFRDQTEERSKQKALFEAKRKITTLFSNLPGMAYRCINNIEWTMEFVSKGCEDLTGYSTWELEENQVVSYGRIIHPDDRDFVWNNVEEAIEKRNFFQMEYRISNKKGEIVWVWERGRGVYDDEGNLEAIEGFIADITERKKAEEELYVTKEIFNHFMEHSPIYVFFKDKNIRSLKLSRNFGEMLGKPVEELIGKNMFELFPSDFAKKMIEDDTEVLQKGETISTEENFAGRNYLTIKFPIKIGGSPTYLAGFTMDITDRKQMQEALTSSQLLFQTLAENASVGIFRTDASGATIYVNPTWCELAGVGKDVALGGGWVDSVHPDDRENLVLGWKKASAESRASEAEYRFIHGDGKIVWVKGKAVPEFNEEGKLQGYIGTIADITEIMNFSETIQRANNLLRTIIDNIPDAIYMKDIDGRKLIANKADLKNIGAKSEKEVIGKTDFDVFPREIAEKFWADDLSVLKNGNPVIHREEKLVNLDGSEKWLMTSKIPFRDKNNNIIGLVGIGHDITNRKKNEEEMLKLTKAVSQSPISIIITNPKGRIEYVNPKFTEITGYSFEEAIGKNPRILKSGAQSPEFYKTMWNTIQSGIDWQGELQNRKKNGEIYWESVIISPIFNEAGGISYYVGVKEDITEKKRMHSELVKAKEKAEESDRLKSAFLANMSHEIRTPLNSILGFSNFLTEDEGLSKEEREEYSGIINKSAESLLQIINDIIDISSLETGQLKTNIRTVNVNEIFKSLYLVFSRKLVEINKSHIILNMDNDENILVIADENRFIQIITNLVNNSMKFTEKGEIGFGVEKVQENEVTFYVSDTGIGISSELHVSIFERFRQAETDKNRVYGGNGLGLSIVKNLVELMGGKIWLESTLGKGSNFRFTLPRAKL